MTVGLLGRRFIPALAVLDSPFDLPPGRLLALDLGHARHGVAVCDKMGVLATPLTVLRRRPTRAEDFRAISALVVHEGAVGVLAGLPGDGSAEGRQEQAAYSRQARWARRYAGRLAGVLPPGVPLAFWDESLSTQDADALLRQTGGSTPPDAAAAALFLQDFLEARRRRMLARNP